MNVPKEIKNEPLVDLLPDFEEVILPENLKYEDEKPFREESDGEPSVAYKEDFPCSSRLSRKLTRKSPSKNFDCFICDKKFSTKSNKMIHIKDVHDLEKLHVCSICNFISVSAKYLDVHMKRHKMSKNYLCEHFSKKFFELSHLRVSLLLLN